jgi:hypothetical protein
VHLPRILKAPLLALIAVLIVGTVIELSTTVMPRQLLHPPGGDGDGDGDGKNDGDGSNTDDC